MPNLIEAYVTTKNASHTLCVFGLFIKKNHSNFLLLIHIVHPCISWIHHYGGVGACLQRLLGERQDTPWPVSCLHSTNYCRAVSTTVMLLVQICLVIEWKHSGIMIPSPMWPFLSIQSVNKTDIVTDIVNSYSFAWADNMTVLWWS